MWKITDSKRGRKLTSLEALCNEYPDLVAYDESGFEIYPEDFDEPEILADNGYGDRESRRILFWASEEESIDDDGSQAIAAAIWET